MILSMMKYIAALVVAILLMPASASALTPLELQGLLAGEEKPTLIDVRDAAAFRNGHLPGAINIFWQVCERKNLPPVGRVVAYGDGLDEGPVNTAVAALNRKAGITAEKLDGGILAWEALNQPTTHESGLSDSPVPQVTYQQLQEMVKTNPDLVLVDLRRPPKVTRSIFTGKTMPGSDPPLTDLAKAFPRARVSDSAFEAKSFRTLLSAGSAEDKLYVLIDSGDGSAETAARRMKGAGKKRVVILAGGEEILMRSGQPGLEKK